MEHFDVLIVGAGLSGIAAAYHLQERCPSRNYAIIEARQAIGGTWDLFRYPGIRSDSDMYTFGFAFRPWTEGKVFADMAAELLDQNSIPYYLKMDWASSAFNIEATALPGQIIRIFVPEEHLDKATGLTTSIIGESE